MKQRLIVACLCLLLVLSHEVSPGEAFAENAVRPCIPVIEPSSESTILNWTSLSPCPGKDQLLGLALEDLKDTESDFFRLVILDAAGNVLSQTWDVAVSAVYWLDSDNILYFSHDSIEMDSGKGILWNPKTDQKTRLLPWLKGGYQATCWDFETRRLLFTAAETSGECMLYEAALPTDGGQINIQTVARLPFAPYRVFWIGPQSVGIEHPETHALYFIM
jgi:hypothetical protein